MINGKDADIENWAFLAQLVFEPDYFFKTCSATLYTRKNLMTAAHRVNGLKDKPEKLKVKIGKVSCFLLTFYRVHQKEICKQMICGTKSLLYYKMSCNLCIT